MAGKEEGANGAGLEPRPPNESGTFLKLALRAARAGSWAWDLTTGETSWSEEYYHLVGASPGAVRPSYEAWLDTVHPDDRQRIQEEFQEALAKRSEIELEYRLLRGDGSMRWMGSRGQVLYDEEGTRPLKVVGVSFDITERRAADEALRESEERFRAAVENLLDCLGIYTAVRGADGRIVDFRTDYVNAAACANNRMSREEQVGKLLCELLPAHRDSELFHEYCRVVETGEPLIKETLHYEDDYPGQRLARSFDIRAAKLGDGFIAVWRDVTGRKQAEHRLLESEAMLREADRRKDEFLAMLAHELRNPLASIRNALEVQRRLGSADDRGAPMRAVIERQTEQLTRLVDDLLDVSRISQGKITLRKETVDLRSVVTRAVETSRPLIDAAGHRLSVSVPPGPVTMEGDAARLAQAISNLLNNAAKYTERGGNVWLTATVEDGAVEVRVRDDGIGIPAEALPRVFDLFAQADRSLDRAQGGLGIGLTLVKNIVALHGGSAEIFSPGPGQGCEVVLRLPRGAAAPQETGAADLAAPQPAPRPQPRCRVLVVDDNVDAAESLALLLQITGQEVRTAHEGRGVVDLAVSFAPHLILLDIGLPGMDGYQVAADLRRRPELRDAVLVAVTGYGRPEDRQQARAAGFDHHLTKPVDYEVLQSLIARLRVC